jgi:hypothetical protein
MGGNAPQGTLSSGGETEPAGEPPGVGTATSDAEIRMQAGAAT